ncbi:hypothetical protein [Pedobacter gandavensis]|uniref:Tail fiber protein n=1 Tax=Pedobacter gandavensis TaxID=2679963 RepID=A0ABR6EWG7_9SPHI|nr:hypothetical protein [Pedobacter gandavensis]MBB2148783.1 hypothetical protein [Pedobacter gandavensis]
MAEKNFPEGYARLNDPAAGTKFIVARASDGKMYYVLLSDILNGTLKASDLEAYQLKLASGSTIKTINGQSILGSGDVTIVGGGGEVDITKIANAWGQREYELNELATLEVNKIEYLFRSAQAGNSSKPTLDAVGSWLKTEYTSAIPRHQDDIYFNTGYWAHQPMNLDGVLYDFVYESLVDDNVGNSLFNPNPLFWKFVGDLKGDYVAGRSYKDLEMVKDSTDGGRIYISKKAYNYAPLSDLWAPNKWTLLGAKEVDLTPINDKVSSITRRVVELENKPPGSSETKQTILAKLGAIALTGSNTGDQDLSGKVDKVVGKSLISDTEITRLAGVANVDISGKVDKVPGKSLVPDTEIVRLAGLANQDISGKANLIGGVLATEELPEIPLEKMAVGLLSPLQFEPLPDGNIGIKTSYLQSLGLGGGGNVTPGAPTNPVVNDTLDTFTVTPPSGYLGADLETQIKSAGVWGAWTPNTSATFNVGNVAIPIGDIQTRVKAASGRNASAAVASTSAFTVSGGGGYIVENTYLLNFCSEYGSFPETPPPYFNSLKPSNSLIQVDNGFTSPVLINDKNIASAMKLTNTGAFSGASGMVSSDQDAAGETSVFENSAVNTAWNINGGTNAKIKITGLKTGKFYQIYGLMPVSATDSVRGFVIAGVTKNKTATTILGSFPVKANGLNDPQWIVYNNITGSEVEIAVKRVSGDYGAFLSMIVIEESNTTKP